MAQTLAEIIVAVAGIYLGLGLLFAIVFVIKGVERIDPTAREGTRGFRMLILPGSMVFWPLLARRWLSGVSEPPAETNAHRRAARARDSAGSDAA